MICVTESGQIIGVEIAQWAHEKEMAAAKLRAGIEEDLRSAIGTQAPNRSGNFSLVVFFPQPKVYLTETDRCAFRISFLDLISHVDRNWPPNVLGQSYRFSDLARFPPVHKYIAQMRFVAGESSTSPLEWIVPAGHTDSYDVETMLEPLLNLLEKKVVKCRTPKTPSHSMYLLIAYDQAIGHCSPIAAPTAKILDEMASALDVVGHPFRGVFVLRGGEVHQVPVPMHVS